MTSRGFISGSNFPQRALESQAAPHWASQRTWPQRSWSQASECTMEAPSLKELNAAHEPIGPKIRT